MARGLKIYDDIDDVAEIVEKEEKSLVKDVRKTLLRRFSNTAPFTLTALILRKINLSTNRIQKATSIGFDSVLRSVVDRIRTDGLSFTKRELSTIGSLKSNILDSIKFPNDRFKQNVKDILVQNIGKGVSVNQLIDGLASLPNTPAQAKTLVNTSLQRFYRDTTFTKIKSVGEFFRYVGPVDSVTRPFCAYHARKNWTKDQAEEIHAKQQTFYNCRHDIRVISEKRYDSEPKFPVKIDLEG